MDAVPRHPVRLLVADDLERSRLTVFFRWLLAIPHLLWLGLWSTVALVIVVIAWFATLVKGQTPKGLHEFLAGYLRYATQVEAYFLLAANTFPPFFAGSAKPYSVDLEIDPPARQKRWKTLFRLVLAIPALLIAGLLFGGPVSLGLRGAGLAGTAALLVWFAALAKGKAPRGLRDAIAWSLGYSAQAGAYLFLLTDRYPNTDPLAHLDAVAPPEVDEHVPRLANDDDGRRSRITVLLRLPLAFPHIVWLIGWTIFALVAAIANWFCALAIGRAPQPLARFLAAYVRYSIHVSSFLLLVGNPFPGFVGKAGSYPIDLHIEPFERQSRWTTLFRLVLAVPAALMAGAAGSVLYVTAPLSWFAALVLGRIPTGLQRAGAYALGYGGQLNAYAFVLTDRYPHAAPAAVFTPVPGQIESLDSELPGAFV